MASEFALRAGARIAVIGGGPAGAFFAHFAQKEAEQRGLTISIAIFDGKDFLQRGPRGCNLCAGVISASLEHSLREEGIDLPPRRIISRIEGYSLHLENRILRLPCTEFQDNSIATVFRGNGPRFSKFTDVVSFDDFLLTWAGDRGAEVIAQPVWEIRPPDRPSAPIVISYGDRRLPLRYEADLAVGAFGVNASLSRAVRNLGFGYVPPVTITSFQAEFRLGRPEVAERFGNDIHVYMPRSKTIHYATMIPKGDYVTVTLVGKKNATPRLVQEFLALEEVRRILPVSKPHCFCYPRIPVSAAQNPFGDRFVLVGDASFCRHYKNGIESAFLTARLAAAAAFSRGVAASAFRAAYLKPARKLLVRDNRYGRVLFKLNDLISAIPLFSRAHFSLAKKGTGSRTSKKIRAILWNMFTGGIPYRQIFQTALDPRLPIALLQNTIPLLLRKQKNGP